jgi:glycosyltransferase involved in cell wall biosynthesis
MVHTVHNLAPREHDSAGRLIQRLAFNRRVNAVAVGEVVRLSFRAYYRREPGTAIRNGIDIAAFRRPEARLPWRKAHGFSEEDFLIASVGRLDPQKNPLALIDSFASAFTATPAAHLLLAGDGTLREAARQRAASHGLAARVHFLGVQTETAALLNAADLFALASDWEGTPLAVMEAMAAGLPVVATCVGGVPELVHHNEAGLLVSRGDTAAFAQSLARLAADPGLRAAMSAAAFDNARRFDIRIMVAAYAALFERLAGGRA